MSERVLLFKLYERRSKNDRQYFIGFLGTAKVIVFKNERAELRAGTIAEWDVFVEEKDADRQSAYSDTNTTSVYEGSRPSRPKPRPAPITEANAARPFDDAPFVERN
jgi:hypothetical protein